VGAGAYTAAVTMGTHHWPFPFALVAAAVIGFAVGIVVGLPSLRIRGQYLAMITLGFAVAFPYVIRRFSWFTGGLNGPSVRYEFLPPAWLHLTAPDFHRWTHLIVCLIALLTYVGVRRIVKGPFGRQIRAVADNPASATAFGLRVGWVRVWTVALSGSVAAVGGALLVFETPAVSADTYNALFSLSLYAAAVFGGIGTLIGGFLGALLIIGAPWLVSKFGLKIDPELIGGVVLVIFTLAARDGVVGLLRPWFRGWVEVDDPELTALHRSLSAPRPAGQPDTAT
jgi:branched-chain amino acid transport system permease protein